MCSCSSKLVLLRSAMGPSFLSLPGTVSSIDLGDNVKTAFWAVESLALLHLRPHTLQKLLQSGVTCSPWSPYNYNSLTLCPSKADGAFIIQREKVKFQLPVRRWAHCTSKCSMYQVQSCSICICAIHGLSYTAFGWHLLSLS